MAVTRFDCHCKFLEARGDGLQAEVVQAPHADSKQLGFPSVTTEGISLSYMHV